MRKNIVAGNWKMNNDLEATTQLLSELKQHTLPNNVEVIVTPTFTNLYSAHNELKESSIQVAAQNMHQADCGAYTGEISASMLKSVGVE
ncbi:MAG: triose-phosphate isomerase, partial [Flavobacteriaceae bacterium]|nr:triose-phosphate isomerase [Flavobacteriaceae bacterium]